MRSSVLQARLINRLRLAGGGIVSARELIDALHYDDSEGGPIDAGRSLRRRIHRLRRRGFPIMVANSRGYYYGWKIWEVVP